MGRPTELGKRSAPFRSGALADLAVTWASRTEAPGGKTSPEELIAGAHATCFTMALALVLGEAKTPPDQIETSATCVLDEVHGAPRITRIDLDTKARVAGIDEATFQQRVAAAAALCPVSNALRGNVEIGVSATLHER